MPKIPIGMTGSKNPWVQSSTLHSMVVCIVVYQQCKSDPVLLLFTISLYGGKIESYKHDSVIQ